MEPVNARDREVTSPAPTARRRNVHLHVPGVHRFLREFTSRSPPGLLPVSSRSRAFTGSRCPRVASRPGRIQSATAQERFTSSSRASTGSCGSSPPGPLQVPGVLRFPLSPGRRPAWTNSVGQASFGGFPPVGREGLQRVGNRVPSSARRSRQRRPGACGPRRDAPTGAGGRASWHATPHPPRLARGYALRWAGGAADQEAREAARSGDAGSR